MPPSSMKVSRESATEGVLPQSLRDSSPKGGAYVYLPVTKSFSRKRNIPPVFRRDVY